MFDYETKDSYTIRVRSTDQGALWFEKQFTIAVTDLNETPTNTDLSSSTVPENQLVGSVVGVFSTTDPDSGNTFTYTLVSGTGDTDNGSFNIDGNNLRTSEMFDYETKDSYTIRVRSTDQGALWFEEKQFTIAVTDLNETPTNISLSPSTLAENQPINTIVGAFSTTDPDSGDTFAYTLVSGIGDTDNGSFNIDGNNLRTSEMFDYEIKNSYTIRVRSTDQGGLWFEEQLTISVADVNETPATNATLNIQIDTGAHAPIYIEDTTDDKMVVNGDVETTATIAVAGGHSYRVWLGGNVTYYVKHIVPPGSGWVITSDGQTAYGDAAPNTGYQIHFTSNPS